MLGFHEEGESRNWIEVADEIPELDDGYSSRGREEADGVETTFDVAADDFDVGRGGVADAMAIYLGWSQRVVKRCRIMMGQ